MELNPSPIPDAIKSFINDSVWASCKALEQIQPLYGICSSLETDVL